MSTSVLMEKAKEEIRKVLDAQNNNSKLEDILSDEKKMNTLISHAIVHADRVIKLLIAATLNRSVDDLFESYSEQTGYIEIDCKTLSHKYSVKLDIVNKDYIPDFSIFEHEPRFTKALDFLLGNIKILYYPLKNYLNSKTVFEYELQIENNTIYLDVDCDQRISFVINKVNNLP